jgi:lipopolysaccharide export system permease protein
VVRPWPRVLDRYFGGRFVAIYAATLASFTLIYVLVDSVSQYGALSDNSKGFGGFLKVWLQFYAAQVPILFCRVLGPVTAAASAAFTVTLFGRTNELTPILSAGISLRRQAAPIVILAALSVAASTAIQEGWIPAKRDWIRESVSVGRGKSVLRHVMYYDSKARVLVALKRYSPREFAAKDGVLILSSPAPGTKGLLIEARSAAWVPEKIRKTGRPGRWILRDVLVQEYDGAGRLIPVAAGADPGKGTGEVPGKEPADPAAGRLCTEHEEAALDEIAGIEMLPQDLANRQDQESYLRFDEILRQVDRSPDAFRWKIRLFSRIVDPLHGLVLVLLGIPIILSRGSRNIFLSAIAIIVASSLYFVAHLVFLNLGNRGYLSPGLATGLAPLLFGALGITLYAKMPT